jgi:uncharacterized protein involved in response to NO
MSIPAGLARRRDYSGPALFSYGFRPFFLGGAIWAALAILVWIPLHAGALSWRSPLPPLDWHIHEMLYGYVPAIVAGFLLTAIPNWTGRLPVCGAPLAGLVFLWLAGRVAMLTAGATGLVAAAAIDSAFLAVLLAVTLREILSGKNWRNMRVLALVIILLAGNLTFHFEIIHDGAANYGTRIGIAAIILLISLVGGRIVPSFTHNWLVRENPGRLPVSFNRFDGAVIVLSAISLLSWIAVPTASATGVLLILAGFLHIARLARWAGDRTLRDRLVLALHVAYAFVPLGFLLTGAAVLWPYHAPASAGIHAWTAGAVGLMTMAVMTRASLGHTGQGLVATPLTQAIYVCLLIAALLRIAAACTGGIGLLHASGTAWVFAFAGFAFVYGPLLIGRPPAWARR